MTPKVRASVRERNWAAREINGNGCQASESGADERLGSPRSRGRSTTSRARNRDLRWNRLFFGVGSFVAALRGPLFRWMIHDRGGPSKSSGIVGATNWENSSGEKFTTEYTEDTEEVCNHTEQISSHRLNSSAEFVRAMILTEC
jgi:hypothetical protein